MSILSELLAKLNIQPKNSQSEGFEYSTVISIDTNHSTIHYYSMIGNDPASIRHDVRQYSGLVFDKNFFVYFKNVLAEFSTEIPSDTIRKVTVVLPDKAVSIDALNVPTMKSKASMEKSLDLALGEIYKNKKDLSITSHLAMQNKQYSTYTTAAVQKWILASLNSSCSENRMFIENMTYASAATVSALPSFNPKLKGANYLFLDIRDTYSRFVFVVGGRAVGYYTLPFGLEFLARPKLVGEDMLFDHSMAEQTIRNARDRAKARKSADFVESLAGVGGIDEFEEVEPEEDAESAEKTDAESVALDGEAPKPTKKRKKSAAANAPDQTANKNIATIYSKYAPKKTPRKLPKGLQRPIPKTDEGITCENFRVFIKQALTILAANEKITRLGAPEFICVNVPESLAYVIDYANSEKGEHVIDFVKLATDAPIDESVALNLELYGALYPKNIHPSGKF